MNKIIYTVFIMAIVLVQLTSAAHANSAKDLLSARSMTEKQYLNKIPKLCDELYGPMAVPAAKLLWKNSGPVFAMDAMTRAYGEIWTLKGPLNVNERSLATVSALVAQGLYPQIKLHINGFISSGGTVDELYGLIGIAAKETGLKNLDALVDATVAGLKWREESIENFVAPTKDEALKKIKAAKNDGGILEPNKILLDKLSVQIALGNMTKVDGYMKELVANLPISIDKDKYVDLLITHLIVYCGYPRGMNAFNSWQKIRSEFGLK